MSLPESGIDQVCDLPYHSENMPYSSPCVKQEKSNRKAMNRSWSNQKANPTLKTKNGK